MSLTTRREGILAREGARWLRAPTAGVAVLSLVTALAGSARLGSRSIWGDEAISISYALSSFNGMQRAVRGDPNMSLYYALLWVWAHLFGDGLIALKSLSVLFAALTVPAVYEIGRRLAGPKTGLIAALLLATNAFFLRYAQEARGYSLVTLLVTLSILAFVAALEDERAAAFVCYVAASALAFYAHFFAAYVILAELIVLAAVRRRAALTRAWAAAYAAIGLLIAPILYKIAVTGAATISWIPRPGWRSLADAAHSLAGESYATLAVVSVIAAWALVDMARTRRFSLGVGLSSLWIAVPVIASFVVSQVQPMFLPRYLTVTVPGVALLVAMVLSTFRPAVSAAALTALLLLSIQPLIHWYDRPAQTDWKAMAHYLNLHAQAGDSVFYEISAGAPAIGFYARHNQAPALARLRTANFVSGKARVWLVQWQGTREISARLRRQGFVLMSGRNFHGSVQAQLYARS